MTVSAVISESAIRDLSNMHFAPSFGPGSDRCMACKETVPCRTMLLIRGYQELEAVIDELEDDKAILAEECKEFGARLETLKLDLYLVGMEYQDATEEIKELIDEVKELDKIGNEND